MDKKTNIFLSCLLIAIPVAIAAASFIVPQEPEAIQGVAVTKAIIPTDVISPTPTLYISQKSASTAAKPKTNRVEIRATVTLMPTAVTPTPTSKVTIPSKPAQQTPTRSEPTPTIYIYVTPAPTIRPTVQATKTTATPAPASAVIVNQPASVVITDNGLDSTTTPNSRTSAAQVGSEARLQTTPAN